MSVSVAKSCRPFQRLCLAGLALIVCGCAGARTRGYSAARPQTELDMGRVETGRVDSGSGIVLEAPTESPSIAQATPLVPKLKPPEKPPAKSPWGARRPIMPLTPDKPAPVKPPDGSLALPKSNAPADTDTDPDLPPSPMGRDNRLPRSETLPRITADAVTVPPAVELLVNSPLRKQVGTPVTFQVAVRNASDTAQENLVVRCRFDDGLVFSGSDRREVVRRLDRLATGETRDMALTLVSEEVGSQCCWFTVARLQDSQEVELSSKQVCVDYVVRQVDIETVGPSQRTVGSRAEFSVTLINNSAHAIPDAQVLVTFDKALYPRELSAGAEQKAGQLTWRLGTLEAGERVQLQMEFECQSQAHRACLSVEVRGEKFRGDADEACLEIIPVPGTLDLRVSDDTDPLEVGKTGTYQVTVENIGLQSARQVRLEAVASENLKILSATVRSAGVDVPLACKPEGNKLVCDTLEQLEPGTHLVYTIQVEALSAGLADLRASLTSALNSTPVTTVEPTIVVAP